MVLLCPPNPAFKDKSYDDAYNAILSQHRRAPLASASSIIILVSPDVDALCAAKMLADLFKQDSVLFRTIPVSGMADLEKWREELRTYKELHTLILLNMGAILDLPSEEWFGVFDDRIVVHVIDSNRPQNLSSLFGSGDADLDNRIVLWDDGGTTTMSEERKAWESVLYEPEVDDSDSDEDFDFPDDENDDELEDQEAASTRGEFGETQLSRKRSDSSPPDRTSAKRTRFEKRQQQVAHREARRLARENRLRNEKVIAKHYTSGTWYGQSVAGIMYALVTALERVDNEMLWLAIIGLTFQFTSARISRDTYEQYQRLYADEVVRLNPAPTLDASGAPPPDFEGVRTLPELRFTLLRHWSLYDAMIHSSYVANKLSIWKERGRRKLAGLFAKMGYSIPDAQQSYNRIPIKSKEELTDRLDQIAPEYGLAELSYPSFVRHFGYQRHPIGAADMVEALSALMDVGGRVRVMLESTGNRNGGEWFSGGREWEIGSKWRDEDLAVEAASEDTAGNVAQDAQKRRLVWWIRNFWSAYDALAEVKNVYDALYLSMGVHRSIIREGCSIIEKQQIKTMNRHRVVVLNQGPELELLAQPGTLSRLALWLVDAHRDKIPGTQFGRSKRKCLPFVVACLDEKAGSYLIVGVTAALEYGDVRKNPFGLAFLDAKERCNARTRHGSFDTSVLEINQADLAMFLQALCNE